MEFTDVATTRRSIRAFTDQDISEDDVEKVVRMAMTAPSAGNQQPWEFLVVRDKAALQKIPDFHPYAKMVANAPVAIVVCGNPVDIKWPAFWPQDCAAAAQTMLLAARDLGLGSVWAGIYPEESRMAGTRDLFGIPAAIMPFALIVLGWPAQEFKAVERFNARKVRFEKW